MSLLEQTQKLCNLYKIKPARSKGQNFLIQAEIYDDIIAAADLKPDDVILEVGPGLGFLTAKLALRLRSSRLDFGELSRTELGTKAGQAGKTGRVIAVELDDKLAETLKTGLIAKEIKNVEVVNENILDFSIKYLVSSIMGNEKNTKYKIVANLPYNITSIFLRKFLEMENKPELMVLMLQKEVAERICAKTGKMSLLAVSVQLYAKPEIIRMVGKENFWPEPEVGSAIIKLIVNPPNPLFQGGINEKDFFRLVKFGFSAKRKMLKNNLAAGFKISQLEAENKIVQAGFNSKIRAQELSVDDWFKLLSKFY